MKALVSWGLLVLVINAGVARGTGSGDRNPHQTPAEKDRSGTRVVKLAEEEECRDDVRMYCKDVRNNFAILECLQNERRDLHEVISDKCNHLLWGYKMNLTQSGRIEDLAREVCEGELQKHTDCQQSGPADSSPGHTISCMTEKLNDIKDERCRQYLLRLAAIVFSDYRLIRFMVEECRDEIDQFHCGRVSVVNGGASGEQEEGGNNKAVGPHSQGSTTECLTKHARELGQPCHKQILRLAELQSDDFHLDRPLFFACRDDREKFCENILTGEGRVYKCLMKNKMKRGMSKECSEQLTRRQQLTVQDYRVSRGFVRACRAAIAKHQCRRGSSDDSHEVKLSKILLCLENAVHKGEAIDGGCREEMLEHRKQLMSDYQLSPNLILECRVELEQCGGMETGGRTLHCLMHLARSRKRVTAGCWKELESVVKETDAGEDWRVDPVLHEACLPMVETACKDVRGGNARVMRCLMRHLSSPEMPTTCEAALLEIQYFISRDWKLDPQLHAACLNDSTRLCHAKRDWTEATQNTNNPQRGAQVLPCLFRHAYHPQDSLRLDPVCLQEVQRVMHDRAAYVDLHPEIESVCMESLAKLCSKNTGPKEEMTCLQDNLEKLEGECKDAITKYIEVEAKDTKLNSQLTLHCSQAITQMCSYVGQTSDEDDTLMECLIRHKNVEAMRGMTKCRAEIEHFQLLSLKDYTFSPKFKEACQNDVATLCSNPKPKNKADVVECLSSTVREAVQSQTSHQVSRPCRQQLRQQLVQRHENIQLDPTLLSACQADLNQFCAKIKKGRGATLECLRNHRAQLHPTCHQLVFVRQQEELQDPGTDVVLITACRQMKQVYCHDADSDQLLYCLRDNKDQPNFDGNCRIVVVRRLVEQTTDARLDPQLLQSCRKDLAKFCSHKFERMNSSATELNGILAECLKEQLPNRKLSTPCRKKVLSLTRSAALNYKMDPLLIEKCKDDMRILCVEESESHMTECLKLALEQGRVKEEGCRVHLAHLIQAQRADIQSDPLLNRVCAINDNMYCSNNEEGSHLACLLDVLDRNPQGLKAECRETLRKRREMYNTAMKVTNIASIGELVVHVSRSSERTYLLLVLASMIGIIFIGGLFCGRATKRYKLLKDR